jgi:hypothetical protein
MRAGYRTDGDAHHSTVTIANGYLGPDEHTLPDRNPRADEDTATDQHPNAGAYAAPRRLSHLAPNAHASKHADAGR